MDTNVKKKDDEFSFILAGCGVFTIFLVIADFFWAKWGSMNFWLIVLIVILHGLTAFAWYKIVRNWKDPNYDYWRKIVIATAIAAILVIMGHRAGWLENEMFKETVEQHKTGQV